MEIKGQLKGAKRGKKKATKKFVLEEPKRRSLYDIVVENLRLAGRKTFLHRFIYVGRHTFQSEMNAIAMFERTISTNGIEPITGLYLHFKNQFLHVIETDEDSIQKHLKILYSSDEFNELQNLKLLGDVNHINSRLNIYWSTFIGTPKKLVNPPKKATTETPRDTAIQVFNCINKINRLVDKMYGGSTASVIGIDRSNTSVTDVMDQSVSVMLTRSTVTETSSSSMMERSSILGASSPYRDFLPERELLDYLIDSPYTRNLDEYINVGSKVIQEAEYNDKIWPISGENVQYDILDKTADRRTRTSLQGAHAPYRDRDEDEDEDEDEEEEREQLAGVAL